MATAEGDHMRRRPVRCAASARGALDWSVKDGARVEKGQSLGSAGSIARGSLRPLVAPCRGTLRVLGEQAAPVEGEEEQWTVAEVEYCIHPVRNGRVCLMCLEAVDEADEEDEDDERKAVNVVSHGQVIRLNLEEAKKFDIENIKRQLATKKLSLVLDLDHTLLHAVRVADVLGEVTKTDDTHFFFIPGLPQQHVVKLRPGLDNFLKEASAMYDLFIYTHGTRLYAEQIAKIIDPDDSYFHHRIVARTDTPDMVHKSLKLLFPSCDDSMIMVLDDRIDVWKENEGNVFLIEPYHYFKCTAEINNASGNGVLGVEEEDGDANLDNHLEHTLNVLKSVHESFFEGHADGMTGTSAEDQMSGRGKDVKAILNQNKRSILQGCNIVFSGVFPIVQGKNYESHYLWRLSVELGAAPSMTMTNFPLTHLVIHPDRLGTQKHVQARGIPGVQIVCPEWILKCARSWTRVSEKDFQADEWKQKRLQQAQPVVVENPPPKADGAPGPPTVNEADTAAKTASSLSGDATPKVTKPVVGILVRNDGTTGEKAKKQVKFAEKIDDNDDAGKTVKMQQASKAMRARTKMLLQRRVVPPRPLPTGTVASGGTFDFLSKITKIHQSRVDSKVPKASELKEKVDAATTKTVQFMENKPDVDDAFQRLIEAEERENASERKRKLDSTDLKDQLASRRRKAQPAVVPNRVALSDDDDDDGEGLDDLEADILGDL